MKGNSEIKQCSRKHDEMILDWLALRDEGRSIREIGAMYGVQPGSVQRATTKAIQECDAHEAARAAQ